jgi:CheY-like chemotaxis protein
MNNNGPVIIVEDDEDDRELLAGVFESLELKNQIIFFTDGKLAYDYLANSDVIPFLILSDIHMPGLNGPELCAQIRRNEKLQKLYIPFIYFTTTTTHMAITNAYLAAADGFFIKPSSYGELEERIKNIVAYWSECQLPSDYA